MAKPGPLSERTWGRIWARAFINSRFRETVEVSPRIAVNQYLKDFVEPLFDPEKNKKFKHCSHDVYEALEDRLAKDIASGGTEHFVKDLREGKNLSDPEIDNKIIGKMHGNQWWLIDKTVPNQPHVFQQNIPKDRGGNPKPPDDPLTLTEWAMVYAEAVLSEANQPGSIPNFYTLLKNDVAGAVQAFVNSNPKTFPHNLNEPILKLPDSIAVYTGSLPPTGIPSQAKFNDLLQELDDDIDTDYECMLRICLTC